MKFYDDGFWGRLKPYLAAYTMFAAEPLSEVSELYGESIFLFDSAQDFFDNIACLEGTQAALSDYLSLHNYKLSAKRRINIFRKTRKEQ